MDGSHLILLPLDGPINLDRTVDEVLMENPDQVIVIAALDDTVVYSQQTRPNRPIQQGGYWSQDVHEISLVQENLTQELSTEVSTDFTAYQGIMKTESTSGKYSQATHKPEKKKRALVKSNSRSLHAKKTKTQPMAYEEVSVMPTIREDIKNEAVTPPKDASNTYFPLEIKGQPLTPKEVAIKPFFFQEIKGSPVTPADSFVIHDTSGEFTTTPEGSGRSFIQQKTKEEPITPTKAPEDSVFNETLTSQPLLNSDITTRTLLELYLPPEFQGPSTSFTNISADSNHPHSHRSSTHVWVKYIRP
ncbi:uncharacterized protein LOC135201832 [Macrobrachium nipponense]|uniref:uncharacterized protein LOC135201832 n=1 Tax=Macrobrachium nipponense TaxID=159736 RepID=UPI0030C8C696